MSVPQLVRLCFILLCFPLVPFAGFTQDECKKVNHLLKTLETYHIAPQVVDAKLSERTFDAFTKDLDPIHLLFTQQDIDLLQTNRSSLFDSSQSGYCGFLQKTTELYQSRLLRSDSIIRKVTSKPFQFDGRDTVTWSSQKKRSYAENTDELTKRWSKWLKYQVMDAMVYEIHSDTSIAWSSRAVYKLEPEKRELIRELELCDIQRNLNHTNGFKANVTAMFLNAITHAFDPHTTYFSPEGKQSFMQDLSKESLSFGLQFEEKENGEIAVAYLVPGGPAWKSNAFHTGDKILSITLADGSSIDLKCTGAQAIESQLNNHKENKATILIKKVSGEEKRVILAKEKLEVDENVIRGFILQGEKKVGYIALPGFYTAWEDANASGCANDIAKEILKLQKENIDGLILDLRYNGGGSMQEALNLAGIFINYGPVSTMRTREEKPMVMKDMNRGTIYNGPLVVLVNGFSASASEIFAAVLQDYNRAVIVGSPTFGKSTGQTVIPVDLANVPSSKGDLGFVKVTYSQFYRVTGSSHQIEGVQPDVLLPDQFEAFLSREADYSNPIPTGTIDKKIYYFPQSELPTRELAEKSKARLSKASSFNQIKRLNDEVISDTASYSLSIAPDPMRAKLQKNESFFDKMSEYGGKEAEAFKAKNNQYVQEVLQMDELEQQLNETLINDINHDIYIEEAYRIVVDLINFSL